MPSTPAELIEITSRHSVYLEGLKSGEWNKLKSFLVDLDRDITKRLAGRDITAFTRRRLERLLVSIRADTAAVMGDFAARLTESGLELAQYEAGFEQRALNEVLINTSTVLPTAGQIRTAALTNPLTMAGPQGGMLMEGFIGSLNNTTQDRLSSAIRSGYAQGQTTGQILQAVRGTRARGFRDGVLNIVNRDAESVTRTALQHFATQAKQATWKNNADIVKEVMWISTLDGRTSKICQSLDRRRFPLDSGPRPPIHYNERSTVSAVLDDRFATLEEGATRSARDPSTGKVESVPANESYYAWLKRQNPRFVESVIGPTRAKLLREGGLSAQRFSELQLNKQFQPRTLAEIRDLEPVAFNRAEV